MFSWLSSKDSDSKIVALIDIGSGSVGAGLARLNRSGAPTLLTISREELPLRMNRTSEQMLKDTIETMDRAMVSLRKSAALWSENNRITPLSIKQIAVFLAAPWSTTSIRTLKLARTTPFLMSEDILKKMLADETKKSAETQSEQVIIEKIATGLKLNGYPIDTLSNAKVLKAEVTLAVSHAPKAMLDLLQEKASGGSHVQVSFHSFAIPASHALFRVNENLLDTLLIDAGAEVTELVLLKDKTPTARATVPVGTHILLRTLTAHGKMVRGEAETALTLAAIEGTRLGESHKDALYGASKEWSRAISSALVELTEGQSIPTSIHLFADKPALPWFKDALLTEPYPGQIEPFSNIVIVSAKYFERTIDAKVASDPFISAELLYADSRFDDNLALDLLGTNPLLSRPKHVSSSGILDSMKEAPVRTIGVRQI